MKQNKNANSSVFENNTGSVNPVDLANAVNSKLDEKINSGVIASGSDVTNLSSQLDDIVTDTNTKFNGVDNKKLDKNGIVTMSNMGQDVKEAMTGGSVAVVGRECILNENIVNGQISAIKQNFLEVNQNIFDGNFVDGMIIANNGVIDNMRIVKNFDNYKGNLCIIKILANETYTISKKNGNVFRIAICNSYPNFGINDVIPEHKVAIVDSTTKYTVTNNAEGKYLVIYVSNCNERPLVQVELGNTATEIKPQGVIIRGENIGKEEVGYINRTKIGNYGFIYSHSEKSVDVDLINSRFVIPRATAIYTGKRWIRLNSGAGSEFYIDIPLSIIGSTITKIYYDANANNDNKIFVYKPFNDENIDENLILLGTITNVSVYLNGKYTVNGAAPINNKTIEYDMFTNKAILEIKKLIPSLNYNNGYMFLEDLNGIYSSPDNLVDVGEGTNINLEYTKKEYIYGLYDVLMSKNTNYITKNIIGYGSKSDGAEDINLPIYEYVFKPQMADCTNTKKPVILIQASIHGYEKLCAYATYKFFEQLCNEWQNNEQLDFLRHNIIFKVIAIANPYGYDNTIRFNARRVDINVNFESDWYYRPPNLDDPSDLYPGESSMSECETRVLDKWYNDNKNMNIGLIDMHNTGIGNTSQGSVSLCWYISPDDNIKLLARNILNKKSRDWFKNIPWCQSKPNTIFGYVNERTDGTARNQAHKKYGYRSLTADPTWILEGKNTKYALAVNIDVLANAIIGMVKNI